MLSMVRSPRPVISMTVARRSVGWGFRLTSPSSSSASTSAVTLRRVTPSSSLMLVMIWGPLQCSAPSSRILAYVIPLSCKRDLTHFMYNGPKAANSSTSRSDDPATDSLFTAPTTRLAQDPSYQLLPHILLLTYIVVNVNVYMYTIIVTRAFSALRKERVAGGDEGSPGGRSADLDGSDG